VSQTPHDAPEVRPRRTAALVWAGAGLGLALAVGAIVVIGLPHSSAAGTPATPASGEPGIDAAAADLLQLDVLPPPALAAPDFTLTDQHGRPASVSALRGKAVVLSFNDDECQDLCTLLAQDVVTADQDLGAAAKDVVFLSVNANPLHPAVADVAAWTDSHGLGSTDNWVFATGTPAQLAATAASYHVPISVDPKTHEVVHGAELFFIDPSGNQVALGQFGTASANTALFAHDMAQLAVDLLPAGSRHPVAGPTTGTTTATATLNAPAPHLTLPVLGDPSTRVSLAGKPGAYTVVNFWASTCSACVQELPAMEEAHQALGDAVTFLGVDVSDPAGPAAAFARTSGVTYRLLADADGAAAGSYAIPGLPFTAIIGPDGTLLVRHPGTFTAEQLEYILTTLQQS
jgi:cytochrome oxidase Cu insertion factor (SCO1/SenC/PrrC family)